MWNKLAKQDEILLRKKNNEVFGRLFVQCFANVWPGARLSPQTASDGAVCFAKCKHDTLNPLIHSNLLVLQRGWVLNIFIWHTRDKPNLICLSRVVLRPKMTRFVCPYSWNTWLGGWVVSLISVLMTIYWLLTLMIAERKKALQVPYQRWVSAARRQWRGLIVCCHNMVKQLFRVAKRKCNQF